MSDENKSSRFSNLSDWLYTGRCSRFIQTSAVQDKFKAFPNPLFFLLIIFIDYLSQTIILHDKNWSFIHKECKNLWIQGLKWGFQGYISIFQGLSWPETNIKAFQDRYSKFKAFSSLCESWCFFVVGSLWSVRVLLPIHSRGHIQSQATGESAKNRRRKTETTKEIKTRKLRTERGCIVLIWNLVIDLSGFAGDPTRSSSQRSSWGPRNTQAPNHPPRPQKGVTPIWSDWPLNIKGLVSLRWINLKQTS